MKFIKYILLVLVLAAVGLAFQNGPVRKFIDRNNMDMSVSPRVNFYQYANGGWLKNNPIPPSETRWGSFSEITEFNFKALKELLETASKDATAKKGTNNQKVGDFYFSGMDSITIEKAGYTPIKPDLDRISKITNYQGLLDEIAYEHTMGDQPLFAFYVAQDDKNSTRMVPQTSQAGLGLPDRDYYFKSDARTIKIRDAYKVHMTNMFKLIGDDEATAKANMEEVFKLETSLANASMGRVEMRDPNKTYNLLSLTDLEKYTPLIKWKDLMAKMMVKGWDTLIVAQPLFFKGDERSEFLIK